MNGPRAVFLGRVSFRYLDESELAGQGREPRGRGEEAGRRGPGERGG